MKRLGVISILLLVITTLTIGCEQKLETETVTTDNNSEKHTQESKTTNEYEANDVISEEQDEIKRMNTPEISVVNSYNYNYVKHKSLIEFTNNITLLIEFDNPINKSSISNNIKLNISDIEIKDISWKDSRSLMIRIGDIKNSEEFSLIIEDGVKDITNKFQLMRDVVLNLRKIEPTYVTSKLISDDISYEQGTYYYITNTPKLFEVNFTNPVNKEYIEESIIYELNNRVDVKFEWINDMKLYLKMENFDSDKYYLTFDGVKDNNGFSIECSHETVLAFEVYTQPEVYCLDMNTNEISKIHIDFPKDIAWLYPSFVMEDKILSFLKTEGVIVYDHYCENIYYNLETDKQIILKNDHSEQITYEQLLINNHYMIINNNVYTLDGDLIKLIHNDKGSRYLDKVIRDEGIITFYDESLFNFNKNIGEKGVLLSIYDNEKGQIKDVQLDIQNLVHEEGYFKSRYIMVDDGQSIIIEGLELNENAFNSDFKDLNIYKVNVENQKTEMIFENAYHPIYIDNESFMFTDETGEVKIANVNGDIIKELPFKKIDYWEDYSNIEDKSIQFKHMYIDESIVGFENEENLYTYDLFLQQIETIDIPKGFDVIDVVGDKVYLTKK